MPRASGTQGEGRGAQGQLDFSAHHITNLSANAEGLVMYPCGVTANHDQGRVEVRIGHEAGKHVRIKGAQIEAPTPDEHTLTGALAAGWTRIFVLSYWDNGNARLFVFEPDPAGQLAWSFAGFYVRGSAREVSHENNPKRARAAFDAVEDASDVGASEA